MLLSEHDFGYRIVMPSNLLTDEFTKWLKLDTTNPLLSAKTPGGQRPQVVAPLRTKVPWAVSVLVAYDPTPPEIGDLWDERFSFPLQKVYSLVFILLDSSW